MSSPAPTKAQLAVLRWLIANPGEGVFAFYDDRGPYVSGLAIVSRRGAAGRMRQRLDALGWIDWSTELVTDAGRAALAGRQRLYRPGHLPASS